MLGWFDSILFISLKNLESRQVFSINVRGLAMASKFRINRLYKLPKPIKICISRIDYGSVKFLILSIRSSFIFTTEVDTINPKKCTSSVLKRYFFRLKYKLYFRSSSKTYLTASSCLTLFLPLWMRISSKYTMQKISSFSSKNLMIYD